MALPAPYYQDEKSGIVLYCGDCAEIAPQLSGVTAIVTDPPYGLEFMGREWDSFDGWKAGTGFSKPGIGERKTPWPSFTGCSDEFGGANPTCDRCGGRARGKKKCSCESPDWRVKGEKPDRSYGRLRQMANFQNFSALWSAAAMDACLPGAHMLTFGGTRTFHRLACGIEDASWEVRDCCVWCYGSGFPKSLDVSKAIDKQAGAEREVVGKSARHGGGASGKYAQDEWTRENAATMGQHVTAPATDAANEWNGWGTALKPAWEPILVARKPLEGTVVGNCLKHGCGALNIDGCRVEHVTVDGGSLATNPHLRESINGGNGGRVIAHEEARRVVTPNQMGRFPANLIHDGSDEVLAVFPEQSGGGTPKRRYADKTRNTFGIFEGHECPPGIGATSGNASRFFYCAKASTSERGEGNNHPTVKPLALMRYLVRLVKQPTMNLILDCFAGSGTTLLACRWEGVPCIGIERDPAYCEIIANRLSREAERFTLLEPPKATQRELALS